MHISDGMSLPASSFVLNVLAGLCLRLSLAQKNLLHFHTVQAVSVSSLSIYLQFCTAGLAEKASNIFALIGLKTEFSR